VGNDDKVYNSYAYAVIGIPQIPLLDGPAGASQSTPMWARGLVEHLIAALAVSSTSAALDETKIDRIIAGES
jgi:hypothetical protein